MTQQLVDSDQSRIFVGQTIGGEFFTATDYASIRAADLEDPPALYCPQCLADQSELQLLTYEADEGYFSHRDISRACYRDDRCKGRDHSLIQQTILARWKNSKHHEEADLEYSIEGLDNSYDCGATLVNGSLAGVVAELQHGCGCFRTRIPRKIRDALANNYGVYVVLSPTADERTWFRQRLRKGLQSNSAKEGSFERGDVRLGTLIQPGEFDLSVFYSRSCAQNHSLPG